MTVETRFTVAGYELAEGRHYDREHHMWVAGIDAETARYGFDPLGAQTCGDIVAVSFAPAGKVVALGEAFGNLEAAKFVGPLFAPVSGTILRHNDAVVANPSLLNAAPLDHWLIEVRLAAAEEELPRLLRGEEAVRPWFEGEIARFREQGMVAE